MQCSGCEETERQRKRKTRKAGSPKAPECTYCARREPAASGTHRKAARAGVARFGYHRTVQPWATQGGASARVAPLGSNLRGSPADSTRDETATALAHRRVAHHDASRGRPLHAAVWRLPLYPRRRGRVCDGLGTLRRVNAASCGRLPSLQTLGQRSRTQRAYAASGDVMSCHVLSCPVLSCPVLSCPVMLCHGDCSVRGGSVSTSSPTLSLAGPGP